MKKHNFVSLLLLASIVLWAQVGLEDDPALSDIDLSDVVIIEDVAEASDSVDTPALGGLGDTAADKVGEVAAAQPTTAVAEFDTELDGVGEVVEILDAPTAGVMVDVEAPEIIDVATTALPSDSKVELELPGQETSGPSGVKVTEEETISVDFPDEEVRTILRNVADLFDLNVVIPDTLQGRTSVKLRNITWRQVFEVALEPLGFTYVEDRNIIRIKSIEELTTEPVDTRVFVLNYATAEELQNSIAPLIDTAAGGRVQVDVRSNALVITERPSRMNQIQEIIEKLDKATDQVMIETKFIEVENTDQKNIGVNWSSLEGYGASAGPFQREWSRNRVSQDDSIRNDTSNNSSNSSSNNGFSSSSNNGFSSSSNNGFSSSSVDGFGINSLDRPDGIFLESENGVSSDSVNRVSSDSVNRVSSDSVNRVLSGNGTDFTRTMESLAGTSRLDTAVFSADEFRVVISALEQNNDTELVANPTVVTMSNQEATIDIVTEIPQVEFSIDEQTGEQRADGLAEPLVFGTQVRVTPQVNDAGFINLLVIPSVSNQIGTQFTDIGPQPIISRRKAETNVVIKDGYTLAIGGLTQNEEVLGGTAVPVLGSLPYIGRLFSSESNTMRQKNLIIFITAKTLNPDGSSYRDIIDPRVLHQMGVVPADVPGYQLSPEDLKTLQDIEDFRAQTRRSEAMAEGRTELKAIERAGKQAEKDASKLADEAAAAIAKEPSELEAIERTVEQDEKDTSKVTAADGAAFDTSSRSNRRRR